MVGWHWVGYKVLSNQDHSINPQFHDLKTPAGDLNPTSSQYPVSWRFLSPAEQSRGCIPRAWSLCRLHLAAEISSEEEHQECLDTVKVF